MLGKWYREFHRKVALGKYHAVLDLRKWGE
jgi:hypothetical protein